MPSAEPGVNAVRSGDSGAGPSAALPAVAVCVAVVFWGLGPLFVRAIDASAITIVFWRLWIAVPVTIGLAALLRQPLTRAALRAAVPAGLVFAVSVVFSFASFQQTSVANASLIGVMTPIPVLLVAGRLFGERVTRRSLVFAALSIVGVIAVVVGAGSGSGASLKGDLLAFISLFAFTAYFLEMKRRRLSGVPAPALVAGVMLVGAIVVTPVALISSGDLMAIEGVEWCWVLALVLLPGTAGHGLMAWAHVHVDVTVSSLLTLGSPVVSTIGAWLVFDETLTWVQAVGAVLVITGLVGVVASSRAGARPSRSRAAPISAPIGS